MSLSSNKAPAVSLQHVDKLYHLLAYFLMAVLWYLFFYKEHLKTQHLHSFSIKSLLHSWSKKAGVTAALVSFSLGVVLELGQGYISTNRSMDLLDVVANSCGIILAIVVLVLSSQKK